MPSVGRGTGTPKDRDENRRDVCEWDGWVCVLDVIGAPSILRLTRKTTDLATVLPTFLLSCARNAERRKSKSPPLVDCAGCTPEAAKKRSVSRWDCKNNNLMNSLCNLTEVLAIFECRCCLAPWKKNYPQLSHRETDSFSLASHRLSNISLLFSSRFIDS